MYIFPHFTASSEVSSGGPPCCLNLESLASLPEALNGAPFCSIQHLLLLWVEVGGARVLGASMVGGVGSHAPLYLLPGHLCLHELQGLGSQRPMCYVPCCSGFSGARDSAAIAWGLEMQAQPPLLAPSASSLVSSQPILRGTDMWNSLASWCVGQRHLRWAVDV